MEPFPHQWKDTPAKRARWAQMERNNAFLRDQLEKSGGCYLVCHYCCRGVRMVHWSANYNGLDLATADHVIPLSRGGPDLPSNLVISCRPCNMKKGQH
mmetsp:Transcript_2261/g.4801  ORF Transcript_2261/g.4801 Transcript_2261/m.4801 type:complete len:98 (+) Transcript_2261:89-382(+)